MIQKFSKNSGSKTMKIKVCPECGSNRLGDRWSNGRKLRQYCTEDDCHWVGELRTPERRRITDTKNLSVNDFYGYDYIMYDKFGHVTTLSRSYNSETEAMKEIERELRQGLKESNDAGPYTVVLFKTPACVKLQGKMFKMIKGLVVQTNEMISFPND